MEKIYQRIEENMRQYNTVRLDANYPKIARQVIDPNRIAEEWERIWEISGRQFEMGQKILEIGSGFGGFLKYAHEQGLQTFGIEPDHDRAKISIDYLSNDLAASALVAQSVGESLPFPTASFDYIYSTNVLEHVNDPAAVIAESIRILKPGGIMQVVVPNYGSWWEGHYGILWFPNMPKWLAKIYVRFLYKKDPAFLDTLQFINRKILENILAHHADTVKVLSWGQTVWINRMKSLNFSTWGSLGTLKRMVEVVHRLHVVDIVLWIGKHLHWETPLIVTIMKQPA